MLERWIDRRLDRMIFFCLQVQAVLFILRYRKIGLKASAELVEIKEDKEI